MQLVALKALPYSTSQIDHISLEQADADAAGFTDDGFRLGPIGWDLRRYAADPKLAAARAYFSRHCPYQSGVSAAICVTDHFSQQFPFGEPRRDFFAPDYDLAADLAAHTERGEAGHCVTRSGLAAAVLLSVGIPARVAQFLTEDGKTGHTVFSVWDEKHGWVAVDPSFGILMGDGNRLLSPRAAFRSPEQVHFYGVAQASNRETEVNSFYSRQQHALFHGQLIYPEPWLYLRTGDSRADWPMRARFVLVGEHRWWAGPAQASLRFGSMLCLALIIIILSLESFRMARQSRTRRMNAWAG